MAVAVFTVHEAVVVFKVFVVGVVRRVDIDNIYLALMGIGEGGEDFEVVAFDKDVVWGVWGAAGDVAFLYLFEDGE